MQARLLRTVPHPVAFALATLGALALAVPAATPAPQAATRPVTVTLTGTGTARWTISGAEDDGQMTMRYSWRGAFRFRLPARVFQNPAKARFFVSTTGTLTASWTGGLNGRKSGAFNSGPYQCGYKGTNVTTRARANLSHAPSRRGRLQLVLRAPDGDFFPSRGGGAEISCTTTYGAQAPPHFDPAWLFRDTVTSNGRLTRDTAYIFPPRKLLPRGSVRVVFPYEVGRRDSQFTGNTRWNNRGRLTIRAR